LSVRLVCPLCGAVVADGAEPPPGACPGCGSRYAGGAQTPPAAVAAALAGWGVTGRDADAIARRLFEADPPPAPAPAVAITSDRREGFYLWWVFARGDPEDALDGSLAEGG
jgi:hypothetical protein